MVRSNQECFIAVDVLARISYNTGKVHFIHLHLKMKLISNAPYVPLTSLITAFATPSILVINRLADEQGCTSNCRSWTCPLSGVIWLHLWSTCLERVGCT